MAPLVDIIEDIIVPLLRLVIIAFFGTIFLVLFSIVWSMPLHNLQLWQLERNFKTTALPRHPSESILLEEKKYLGGPYAHGGLVCDFYAGELRAAPLSRDEIRRAYDGHPSKKGRVSLEVLFFDTPWPMYLPLIEWWGEWYESSLVTTASGTPYFVFAAKKDSPFLNDLRCDD